MSQLLATYPLRRKPCEQAEYLDVIRHCKLSIHLHNLGV